MEGRETGSAGQKLNLPINQYVKNNISFLQALPKVPAALNAKRNRKSTRLGEHMGFH
jgi:hypothetical protein